MNRPRRITGKARLLAAAPLTVAVMAAGAAPAGAAGTAARHQPHATPLAIRGSLHGVAADSAQDAWAVGSTGTGDLIMHWNGTVWRRVTSPDPAGSSLSGVAATSARNAWAVGGTSAGRSEILHWAGTAWQRVPSPGGSLTSVAAVSATDAWAVGGKLILHWNGTSWKQVPAPVPGKGELNAVAATSGSNAWAVGEVNRSNFRFAGLILHWNGRAWRQLATPRPKFGQFGWALMGVTATSRSSAWAVGCTDSCPVGGTPVIERWRGNSWKQVAPPTKPFGLYNLIGVAAVSARSALAVGGGGPVTAEGAAAVHWNGSKWVLTRVRSGAGLTGVAEVSARNAWAVGGTATGHILIEHWNGTTWH